MSKRYFRIMLGQRSIFADQCFANGFIGGDWEITQDLTNHLADNWREFNKEFIPVFLAGHPEKSKVAAGLACAMLHTISKGILVGDIVLCPDGNSNYKLGEVTSNYYYAEAEVLPHRRKVRWFDRSVPRSDLSDALQKSTGSTGTVAEITKYAEELERLIAGEAIQKITTTDETIEDPSVFAMEKHLEEFLVRNWSSTVLGKSHYIYTEDGEQIGQQFPTDTGNIDILAISKDGRELLVVELKRGRASDSVVGQVQRYMGYIMSELAEEGQAVRGCIVALEDDIRIRHALKVNPLIDFYRYEVSFRLHKA